jgi:hypothetical protein
MRGQWHRIHCACVSSTPCTHAKYDTACTIDEQFERPCQPLKGISIQNIYVPELSSPTTKKFKGKPNRKFLCSKIDHISANSKKIQKGFIPSVNQGPSGVLFDGKTKGRKFGDTVPLNMVAVHVEDPIHPPICLFYTLFSCQFKPLF